MEGLMTHQLAPQRPTHAACNVCGKKASKRCLYCSVVSYCSKACQKADQAAHEQYCSTLVMRTQVPQQSGGHSIMQANNGHMTVARDIFLHGNDFEKVFLRGGKRV
jgi:hypothetical protein